MTRLKALNPEEATGKTKELFNAVQGKMGLVPNMMRTMGNSPAVLEGYLNFSGALSHGTLGTKTNELLALAIAEANSCDYCLSVHSYIGEKLIKMDNETILAARSANAANPKTNATLQFAKTLVAKNGHVSGQDINAVKEAGLTDGEIAEAVAHVGLNILTNYFNNTANTEIDFPQVVS